ncbi:MAG TPA: biotin transporter BioY [Candidatus Limnocylindrales bacterium]|jgi:biotin transport system substrate-specific component|nr:biotin transporter BioY [Candidatus Limnocylindrales bacterium]
MTIAMPRMTSLPNDQRGITIADFLVPIRVGERMGVRVRNIALIVIGAVLIYLTARISIPIPGSPVPITGQTFGVLLVGGALGFRRGFAGVLLYVLVGLVGLPWFAEGKGGVSVILGATGGYIVGFVVAGALVGRLAELGWDRRIVGAIGAMVIGDAVIFAIGVPWLMAVAHYDLATGIDKGFTQFVIVDAIKIALAATAFPVAWWVVGRRPGER